LLVIVLKRKVYLDDKTRAWVIGMAVSWWAQHGKSPGFTKSCQVLGISSDLDAAIHGRPFAGQPMFPDSG